MVLPTTISTKADYKQVKRPNKDLAHRQTNNGIHDQPQKKFVNLPLGVTDVDQTQLLNWVKVIVHKYRYSRPTTEDSS